LSSSIINFDCFRKPKFMQALPKFSVHCAPAVCAATFCILCFLGPFTPTHATSRRGQSYSASQLETQFAIADFDGDSRPDLATVHVSGRISEGTRYLIAFELSTGSRQTLGITAPAGGVQISSRDVNGDTFADVVVTTAWTNLPIAVLLNDGKGNFTPSSPSNFPAAFRASDSSWGFTSPDAKDPFALLLIRHVIGDCELTGNEFSPFNLAELLVGRPSNALAIAPIASFSGRAPPAFSTSF
jgi:hypothetical protein